VHAFREGKGTYLPESSAFHWLAEVTSQTDSGFFDHTNHPYEIGLYTALNKVANELAFFKSVNAQVYIMAALYAKQQNLNNVVIQNTDGALIETIAENLFVFTNGIVLFPPIGDGQVDGIMRGVIKKLLIWNNIPFAERSLTVEDLLEAEECFLSNTMKGIQPVTKYKTKEYRTEFSNGLQLKLDERVSDILTNRHKH